MKFVRQTFEALSDGVKKKYIKSKIVSLELIGRNGYTYSWKILDVSHDHLCLERWGNGTKKKISINQ